MHMHAIHEDTYTYMCMYQRRQGRFPESMIQQLGRREGRQAYRPFSDPPDHPNSCCIKCVQNKTNKRALLAMLENNYRLCVHYMLFGPAQSRPVQAGPAPPVLRQRVARNARHSSLPFSLIQASTTGPATRESGLKSVSAWTLTYPAVQPRTSLIEF
jgi:hypothetical protein